MMNSALVNSGKGMKRTRDGIPKAQGLLESQENTSNSGIIIDLVRKYNDFCIAKDRCVIEQIFDLQFVATELERHKILLPEKFQIGMIIAKLPLSLRHFAASVWQCEEEMCVDDLVAAIIEENGRMENLETNIRKLNDKETDIGACWACRKARSKSNCCRRRENAIFTVKKMILNRGKDAAGSCEVEKKIEVKDEHLTVHELNRERENRSSSAQATRKRKDIDSSSGSGSFPCWSCRKMGYSTDICTRRSNKTEKEFCRNKRQRSEIIRANKISKLVLRSCWTCRKKSYAAVCRECQKNIIEIHSRQLQH